MAKMFYTLEETAAKLDMSENDVMELVNSGQLQEFRDRDKSMFKVDQVEILSGIDETDELTLAESNPLDDPNSVSVSIFEIELPYDPSTNIFDMKDDSTGIPEGHYTLRQAGEILNTSLEEVQFWVRHGKLEMLHHENVAVIKAAQVDSLAQALGPKVYCSVIEAAELLSMSLSEVLFLSQTGRLETCHHQLILGQHSVSPESILLKVDQVTRLALALSNVQSQ